MRFSELSNWNKENAYWQWYWLQQEDIRNTNAGEWLKAEFSKLGIDIENYVFVQHRHSLVIATSDGVITLSPNGVLSKPTPIVGSLAITLASLYLDFLRVYREPVTKGATLLSMLIFFGAVAHTRNYNERGRTIAVD